MNTERDTGALENHLWPIPNQVIFAAVMAHGPEAQWFIDTGKSVQGPFAEAAVRRYASQGRLRPGMRVSQDRKHWVLAEESGFLEAAPNSGDFEPDLLPGDSGSHARPRSSRRTRAAGAAGEPAATKGTSEKSDAPACTEAEQKPENKALVDWGKAIGAQPGTPAFKQRTAAIGCGCLLAVLAVIGLIHPDKKKGSGGDGRETGGSPEAVILEGDLVIDASATMTYRSLTEERKARFQFTRSGDKLVLERAGIGATVYPSSHEDPSGSTGRHGVGDCQYVAGKSLEIHLTRSQGLRRGVTLIEYQTWRLHFPSGQAFVRGRVMIVSVERRHDDDTSYESGGSPFQVRRGDLSKVLSGVTKVVSRSSLEDEARKIVEEKKSKLDDFRRDMRLKVTLVDEYEQRFRKDWEWRMEHPQNSSLLRSALSDLHKEAAYYREELQAARKHARELGAEALPLLQPLEKRVNELCALGRRLAPEVKDTRAKEKPR